MILVTDTRSIIKFGAPSTKERSIDKGNYLPRGEGGVFIISTSRLPATLTDTGGLNTTTTTYTVPAREERRNGRAQALYGLVNRTNTGETRRRSQASKQAIRAHTHTRAIALVSSKMTPAMAHRA